MNRTWSRRSALLGLAAVAGAGCTPSSLGWLLADNTIPPSHPLTPKKGKGVVSVVVLASPSPQVAADLNFASAPADLALAVGRQLTVLTKSMSKPIQVVPRAEVERLKLSLGVDPRTVSPGVIGQKVGADYVLDLTVVQIGMYDPQLGREFYKGSAVVQVLLYDTDRPESPDTYEVKVSMPERGAGGTPAGYQRELLERAALQVAHEHVAHEAEIGSRVGR